MWLEDLGDEADPAAALAADGVATRPQIDAAVHYRRAYSERSPHVSNCTDARRSPPTRGEAAARRDVPTEACGRVARRERRRDRGCRAGARRATALDLFATAVADGYVLLTENVAGFARIPADHITAGQQHPGVLIALSSRFSRRPAGRGALVAAVFAPPLSRSRTASSTSNAPIGSEGQRKASDGRGWVRTSDLSLVKRDPWMAVSRRSRGGCCDLQGLRRAGGVRVSKPDSSDFRGFGH